MSYTPIISQLVQAWGRSPALAEGGAHILIQLLSGAFRTLHKSPHFQQMWIEPQRHKAFHHFSPVATHSSKQY